MDVTVAALGIVDVIGTIDIPEVFGAYANVVTRLAGKPKRRNEDSQSRAEGSASDSADRIALLYGRDRLSAGNVRISDPLCCGISRPVTLRTEYWDS